MDITTRRQRDKHPVRVSAGSIILEGDLSLSDDAQGIVLFAHGSGSSRHSPRNGFVARMLAEGGLATLLLDLLTPKEEAVDRHTAHLRFDIGLLAERLVTATKWLGQQPTTRTLRVGYFGASTGGGAALVAAAMLPDAVGAVVSRGGRPDLAGSALASVCAPTLRSSCPVLLSLHGIELWHVCCSLCMAVDIERQQEKGVRQWRVAKPAGTNTTKHLRSRCPDSHTPLTASSVRFTL
jgi:putative phosphoribosyl transferase